MDQICSGSGEMKRFLTFEGPEGSGKTTQMKFLADALRKEDQEVICTREPGGTKLGNAIRGLLLDHSDENIEPQTELFLMLAQRTEHLSKVIVPALKRGAVVLCDRYLGSSMAYQGYGRGLEPKRILEIHKEFLGECLPRVTILLDIDPKAGLTRAQQGGRKNLDRMESQEIDFHCRVREGYLAMARKNPRGFIVLDANGSPEEIFKEVIEKIRRKVPGIFP